ncbi:hypothetical protein KI387_034831, partial [Taxus chinensis]
SGTDSHPTVVAATGYSREGSGPIPYFGCDSRVGPSQSPGQLGRRWIYTLFAYMADGRLDGSGDEPTIVDTGSATAHDTGERSNEDRA